MDLKESSASYNYDTAMSTNDKKITARECRFALHIPTKSDQVPDIHLIKECLHFEDGTTAPNLRFVKNYQRPFYITRKSMRNHHSKKEWELIENLDRFECTQSQLRYRVATALGAPWSHDSLKMLSQSPYLYGTDITSTALIKNDYLKKYPNVTTGYTFAVYDIETDMVDGSEEVILATLVFENKIYTVAVKKFIHGILNLRKLVEERFQDLLGDFIQAHDFKLEFEVVDTPAQAVISIFKRANEWQPDFLAIWNMDFDIPRSLKELTKEGIDPAQALSDVRVPPQLRRCEYREGKKKKITASGRVIPINPSSQWHTLYLTSSFYTIDAMCTYKLLRSPPAQEEPSYSLDYILNKEMKYGKLKFKEADRYSGAEWHTFMQKFYKIEYIIYNIFDCIGVLELCQQTKDLSFSLPSNAGVTDFDKYNSNPKKIYDALYFFCLERDRIVAASGSSKKHLDDKDDIEEIDFNEQDDEPKEETEDNVNTLDLKGWIVTLPAHLTVNNGLPVIEEDPNLLPNIRGFVFDSDSVSAYPSATSACNVSKETTRRELSDIEGISEADFRLQNINLLYGPVNSIEYCSTMFGFPTLLELDSILDLK